MTYFTPLRSEKALGYAGTFFARKPVPRFTQARETLSATVDRSCDDPSNSLKAINDARGKEYCRISVLEKPCCSYQS
ncbi:hypothetical protein VFPPC_17858 [Pochonia chlamydosporia 170]|uniref:Uncharacterized protein n=1 Tax=Pochonia chlamydosporia 170 TaxID=1380566 RepID=A0A219AQQ3_METCM|nr:hypothetical protein VFPPC_17858 [Pochonia chlamydosporia 170]OWT42949.1 hypothetical protein VFPPC_17858 [Pochonia chlamydosporia 170]